ncbi:cold-shock protein [Streptomyces chartreusis]
MASGTVKWFNFEKGFGFIAQDGGRRTCSRTTPKSRAVGYRELTEGEHVTFDIGQGQKGPQAQNNVRV